MSTTIKVFLASLSLAAISAAFAALIPLVEMFMVVLVVGDNVAHSGSTGQEASAVIASHLPTFSAWGSVLIRSVTGLLCGSALAIILVLLPIADKRYRLIFLALPLVGALLALPFPGLTKQIVAIHAEMFGSSHTLPPGL